MMSCGAFFEVDPGIELYYEDQGAGDPLVFVPGRTMSTEAFYRQTEVFSKTHRVISFDPRSQGRSLVTVHGNDYATQSADLCKLIDHLNLEKPVLIGWSFGCLPLWGYVRLRSTAPLKGLVFIDEPPVPVTGRDDGWVDMSVAEAAEFYQSVTTSRGQREFVTMFTREVLIQRELSQDELDWIVGLFTGSPPWVASAYAGAGITSNYLSEAQEADRTLPTLYIIDEQFETQATSYMEQTLPNGHVEFLGGHMMF